MITIQTQIHVNRLNGKEVFEFLTNPTDAAYQQWWPGTHLEFHPLRQTNNSVGDVVLMDEFIGKRRVTMEGVVTDAIPDKQIIWQMQKFIRLPIWLTLKLEDDKEGVAISHTITAGYKGVGKILDIFLRLYFSQEFENAMDER